MRTILRISATLTALVLTATTAAATAVEEMTKGEAREVYVKQTCREYVAARALEKVVLRGRDHVSVSDI